MTLMTGHRWHEEIMLNSLDDGHNLLPNPSRTAAPAGGAETFGCVAVCSTMPSWFPPKMKLDPKANDRVRSSWRLEKAPHPPSEKSANRSTIPAQTGLWAV